MSGWKRSRVFVVATVVAALLAVAAARPLQAQPPLPRLPGPDVVQQLQFEFERFNQNLDDAINLVGFGPLSWSNGAARAPTPESLGRVAAIAQNVLARWAQSDMVQVDLLNYWNFTTGAQQYLENFTINGFAQLVPGLAYYLQGVRLYGQRQNCQPGFVTQVGEGGDRFQVRAQCVLFSVLSRRDCDASVGVGSAEPVLTGPPPCFLVSPLEGDGWLSNVVKVHEYTRIGGRFRLTLVNNNFVTRTRNAGPYESFAVFPMGRMADAVSHPWYYEWPFDQFRAAMKRGL